MERSSGERSSGPPDAPRAPRRRWLLLIIGVFSLAVLLLAANYDTLRRWELSRQSETALLAQAEAQPADTQLQRVAAERLIEADRPRDALRLLEPITAAHREDIEALRLAARAALKANDLREAWGWIQDLRSRSPHDPESAYMQAFYLYATGRSGEAQAALETLTREQPGYAEAWRLLGNLRLNGGDSTGALAALEHSDGKKRTATGAGLRAEALMKLGRLDEAQAAGELAVRLHAGRNERITLARIYQGAPDEARQRQAEALLEPVVAAGEKDPSILMLLATSQRRLGEPAREVWTLRKLLRLDPYSAPAYFMLAHAYRELRKRELSERCLAVYRHLEPYDARVRVARLATLADPSSAAAQLALAASFREEGRMAEATASLERARQLGASGSVVQAEAGRVRKAGVPAPPPLPADPEGDQP